jgi:putative iron-dependent peroxidase
VTGNLFFVPSATFLEDVTADGPTAVEPEPIPAVGEGSLSIGSLKGDRHDAAPAE